MPVRRHPVALSTQLEHLSPLPLDLTLVRRLKTTYALVRAEEHRFTSTFYSKLFAAAPHLREMFGDDLAAQARKLTAALDAVVANLDCPTQNTQMLTELGRRHATYGVTREHYDLVITLLIDSMREVLSPHADDSALEEWRLALRLISDRMIVGGSLGAGGFGGPVERHRPRHS